MPLISVIAYTACIAISMQTHAAGVRSYLISLSITDSHSHRAEEEKHNKHQTKTGAILIAPPIMHRSHTPIFNLNVP